MIIQKNNPPNHQKPTGDQAECVRCGGAGYADKWNRTGLVCYRCGGTGIDPKLTIKKAAAVTKAAATKEAKRAKAAEEYRVREAENRKREDAERAARIEAEEQRHSEFLQKYPFAKSITFDMVQAWSRNRFQAAAADIGDKIRRRGFRYDQLSEKQYAVVERAVNAYIKKYGKTECDECHKPIDTDWKYCMFCGAKIVDIIR